MQKTVSQGFRLSPQQQHVWRTQQSGHSSAFVVQARIDIAGALDRRRLASAAEKVVERHEILRTTFPLLPSLGLPVQSVEDSASIGWSEHSLAGRPSAEREAALRLLCNDIREIPFDLANGPLLRITLIELDGENHAMLLSQPALAADGISLDLLAMEIAAVYHGDLEEGEVFQYADLAEILHDWQGSPPEDPGPAFWHKQDLSALLRVRLGQAVRSDGHPFRPEHVSRTIGRAPVEEAAARLDGTVSLILLAAWHGTLHVSTGEEEIVVGTLFDGRTCLEIESALGSFARYLPVSARSSVDSTLEELSRTFSGSVAELSRRQDFFSSELVERLLAEHKASSWPFGFDYRRPRELPAAPSAPGFAIGDAGDGYLGLDRFDVRLSVHDDGRALRASLVYDPALLPCDEAERLVERFSHVLDGLLAGALLGEIDVLTECERRQVLAFNRTESAVPAGLCAHQLFEEKVGGTPHAAALIHAGRTWTYAGLNARANRLAHHLRASGLGPGSRVGLSLQRSPELVEAVLGVLKAGAAYVPLDPGAPDARLSWMAEDAGLSLLLTDRWLEDHRVAISRQSEDNPLGSADPADLAYVIYTSGSTGQPKGVMIPHRGLVNYLLWARHAYEAGKGTGAPVHSTIAFDLTVTSLLLPLAAGTAVTLLDERRSVEALADALREASGFSLVKLTPAHLDILSRELRPEEYEGSTRALVIGGEALRAESAGPWREHAPQTRLINEYGPTEATVGCCVYEILPGATVEAGHVAIGRPIANTRLHIFGRRLRPVPLGAPGELWIGGDGLARGYLGRPDLTAERFVPDPFAGESGREGERLYRTGDLVRLRPDGELELLGRIDSQIKIRGFRIEPGEIEAALVAHTSVRDAAVLAAQNPAGGMDLVACVAGQAEAGELRLYLSSRLPEYMVPSRFAFFPTLPLTANGKVDRRELARTWREMADASTESPAGEAPRTWTEELLAGMFAELLGVPRVGRSESFFTLGGHSLLATQTVSRVREAFGVEISLRTFFEAPTVAGLAGKVEALRLGGATPDMPPIVPIDRAMREGPLPLSFAQQRLWFIDQLEPGSPLYNIPVALRVEGPLSSRVLALCLGEIVRRHEALRTVFAVRGGAPAQEIQPAEPFGLPVIDLAGLPESRRAAAAHTLSGEEAGRPFDLTRGPMLRGLLLRLSKGDHVATLTMHHIASDGWSMGILVREVTALYEAFSEGRLSPLPELPVQYADFAAWQHSWLHGEALEREISFWRQQLAGLPPRLELPTDRPRPAMLRFRGALRPVRLPSDLTRQAQALSRREGATLFMVLMAGFHTLLARYSGQEDLAVGTPVAGRNRVEIEGLIGFFVNTLVLRGDLSGKPSFRTLLGRGRDTALAAHAHQDVPFERLVQELTPERSLAHTPLFQVVLMLQNAPVESLEIRNLRLRTVGGGGTTAKFDLTLSLEEHDGGLFGTLEYATDLFDAATIDRLIGHYEHLLTAAVAAPEPMVSELPWLPVAERHQLLAEWNDTATAAAERGEETLIHELFELWAARTPGATAALCGSETMTYGQVEERANRLAHHLAGLGIGPGSLVGIHLRRSLGMIPALLAVLKAGAAYVPLEIGHPPARLRWILDTLEISCVLTETEQLDGLPALSHAVCLDRVGLEGCKPSAPPRRGTPGDLAYIIFTSGSTGTPKGVMVRHRPVINLLRWAHETFAFSPQDRVLFVTSLSFDLSVFDVFGLLGAGGSIRIATEEEVRDPERLLRALAEEPVTFWDSAPAALEQTVPFLAGIAGIDPQASPALRLVFLSGDWIPVTLPDRIRGRFPGARVVALGGATEATVWSNVFPVDVVDPAWPSIPYGRPIENARYHVLDEKLAPCPVGVPGDLYIGGDCLADGYAREPELTAHKFIPDPWSPRPGDRLYRTGDRARYRPDGNLEFLGRRDHQVKIRGFRIELGEIEATLATLPGVREAVVIAREDTPGDRRLVAYLAAGAPADELRQALRERLPDHMVPAAFVTLAALPLTPNGKVDRKALPAPEWQSSEESYLAPRTPVEKTLAGIWASLLGIERVGISDNFFDLGGHSLLATRVMSRLRDTFGVEMPLRDLFEAATPAALAIRVEAALRVSTGRLIPPLAPLRRGGSSLPLSFAQQRLWFIDQLEPGSPLYNVPVALRVEGPLRSGVLALCLGEVARRHEVLRSVFAAAEGTPVQIIQPAAPFDLSVVDLSALPERERKALVLASEEAGRPFDLARGPLMRALLMRLAEDDHVLTLTLHHIVSDGWSMGILIREVTALYAAFCERKPSPLLELPMQYADFAAWQRSWLRGEALESEISFWRRQLAGLPPRLDLPTDHPRPAARSFRGASRLARLPGGLIREAQALGRHDEATLFMVLLAGFQALLARYSGQQDLAVGTPVAGRNRVEIEGLIGVFVNTLVLRADLAGQPSFEELLRRVRDTALAAQAHQDLPFEKLVQELAPERSLGQAPLFQVLFGLQNAPTESVHLQDLRLRPVGTAGTTAKFDLSLILEEHNGEVLGQIEYATDLFDVTTIDRLIIHYERLLAAALETPEIRVSELSLLTDAEGHQLLTEWRGTGGQPPTAATLHGGFEAHARQTPEAAALTCEGSTLSYGELNRRSNQLARRLRAQGIGPESRVGLCLERSFDLVVGILGILKAGGAYVPLDPGYPRERLAYMIEDAGVEVVVGSKESVAGLPHTGRQILLDAHCEELATLPDGDLAPLADGESLAYVIYTSGSTGRPKGVLVSHGNVARLFDATRHGFGFAEQDVWTLFHSFAFDFSVWEIWGALLHGGRLVIVPHDVSRSPAMFLDLLIREQVTVLNQTPSAFAQLATADEQRGGASTRLRLLIFGGEALDPASLAPWFARHGDERPRLVNMYGITETTVHVTWRPLRAEDTRAERRSIIGVPLPDLALAVMDPGLRQVPVGVPGELVIGGAGLARGYLGRPGLTAERFVPDPAGLPGARLYRSGDLGRFLPNGEVEYLGRIDHQVKIRGFRVEPGEIEAALLALPGVREAVVVAREDTPGDRRLVAYVASGAPADELRQALREGLPDHMVPAAFVTLAALPLTPNGKVDRKALPAPEWQSSEESYLAPRTPVEEGLARLFGEILRAGRVGVRDSFFELGGHSLLATRLMAAIRDELGVDLPLRLLFERPTVEELAQAVSGAMEAGAPAGDPGDPIRALPRQPGENRFPVSFSQLREWILDRLEPGNPAYNIPSPLRIEGPLAVPTLVEALRTLVRRHEVFRTRFPAGEEEPLQAVLPEVRLEVPVIDLSALPQGARETELRRQAGDEASTGFDLFTAPLLRARIVRAAPEDHALLLTLHHIIADGWSLGILNRELAALYESGSGTCLPALPVQYADYAVWQRRRLQGEALERQAGFWRRQLSGAPPLLELPTDRPRPPVRSNRGGKVPFHLPQPLAGRLGALARQHGATLFMVLLAGVQSLLGRWSGQDDVVVGTYSGNRSRRELEGLIGFFINTLALRTRLPEGSSFAALLGRVRESILEAYAHADLPFEKLLETLQLPRDPSRTPVFQALLVLQNFPPARADLSTGVRLSSLEVASEKVDYDLELWLGEGPGGISGSLRYSAALFDEAAMARFGGQLRTLLAAAVAHPEQNLWTLPLLAENEQTAQLLTWSRGPAVPAGEPLLHRLVQEQAGRTPGAVALEAGSLRLTYAQLVDHASRQAGWLRGQGVGRGSIVALPAERTPELIVSMLAVLQAGAAYLPLDPAYPRERRELMVKDSGAVLLPSNPSTAGDGERGWSFAVSEDDAAYLLYTSGSTGLPKGVLVPHRAIASFVRAARETYGLAPGDRVLQFASLSFDTSAEEIWPALASGATLVLRPGDMAASIPHFLRELERLGITVLDLPTAFWHEMVLGLDAGNLDLPRGLRLVILGGEEALADRFALWHRRAGSVVRLVNTYGPTETTILATRRELADLAPGGLVPIGKPIPGARTYVLDRFSTPVPPGVRGELWIGGAGVARGYLGRPALTAERFVPDPFADEPGARLYRTGDLAYLRPDGDLVFAGRADSQLKVRGYRIEPGEIEAALRLHPAVRDAVADARGTGDIQRLVAWIVPHEGSELPAATDLRAFLRERLPEPMVPAVFAPVAALPLSPSGKVDRRSLPEPAAAQPEDRTHAEPRSALERTIAEIYRGLLQVARIGLNDNFFDLGGHSLLIVRAHQRLREALGREIPVLDLFRFPTVASLARHLGGEDTGGLEKVQTLAEQQRAAQQRRKAAMERLGKHGPARR